MMEAEESRQVSDEDEMSYIYGDEDSSHHKLKEVNESESESYSGYDSGGGNAKQSTPQPPEKQNTPPPQFEAGRTNMTGTSANGALEMKMVAASSVAEDEDKV